MGLYRQISECSMATVIVISAIILFAAIIHLCYVYVQKRKKIKFFLLLSIITLVSYELSLILLIFIFVRIILIDDHVIESHDHVTNHVYYSSFAYLEFVNASFNAIGHLGVMSVFVVRFHGTFYNSLLGNNKRIIIALYVTILLLFLGAIGILLMMCIKQPLNQILIVEFVWDIVIHTTWLWVLYLFISKLFALLNLSLESHSTDGKIHSSLLKSLIEATKLSDHNRRNTVSKYKSHEPKSMYTHTMVIDGIKVFPHPHPSPGASRNVSPETSPEPSPGAPDPSLRTVTVKTTQTDCEATEHSEHNGVKGESAAMDLIGVMTKMTILVVFTFFISVLCGIAHGAVEMEETKQFHSAQHHVDVTAVWAEMFHVVDTLVSSLMLYLQFNFTHKMYRCVFHRLDAWFLRSALRLMECVWEKKVTNDDGGSGHFVGTTNETVTSN